MPTLTLTMIDRRDKDIDMGKIRIAFVEFCTSRKSVWLSFTKR